MSKAVAYRELGPFSRTSRHHRFSDLPIPIWLGTTSSTMPEAVLLDRPDKFLKFLFASELGIQKDGINDVVSMLAAGRCFADRGQIAIGDSQGMEIGHGPLRIRKGEPAMQLQPYVARGIELGVQRS